MFFLAGMAGSSALDLISSLTQGKSAQNAGNTQVTQSSPFDVGSTPASNTTSTNSAVAPSPPMTAGTMNALLAAQGQGSAGGPASQLFAQLDSNGDGTVSKSEFEQAFGQNGNTTAADNLFAKIDTDKDGAMSQSELTSALQQSGGRHRHHHHAHGASNAVGRQQFERHQPDGDQYRRLVTTTVTYSDGTQVTLTTPASSSGSGTTGTQPVANNVLERLIQRQAQMLSASTAGQAVSVSA